jgi:hypothetical protein
MSPVSATIERLAAQHGCPVLHVLEFFSERAAIRQHEGGMTLEEAERLAIGDVEIWIGLWKAVG